MAPRRLKVETTRMRTLDPRGHGRVLHRVTSPAFEREEVSLIEYAAIGLWYIVYRRRSAESWVVPLYDPKLFADDPAGTIAMRYGVPMREVLTRGNLEEMTREIEVVRKALAKLDTNPELRTRRAGDEAHVNDLREALAKVEAAVAKLRGTDNQ